MPEGRVARLGQLLPTRRRRRIAAALALIAAVAVVVAIVADTDSSSATTSGTSSSTASGTATVERRNLVETDTESGTLSYARPRTVYNRLSGTITWLPGVGQVIKPGHALYRVDQEPVLLMDGSTPAYRDLNSSDSSGQDILELNRNLVALGYDPDGIVVDDTWQAATTAGVEALQAALGETESGALSLGQVVFLPGEQLVSTVDATVGSAGGSGSGNSSPSSGASDSAPTAGPEFASLEIKPSAKPRPGNKMKTLEALIALLRAEIAELRSGNHSAGSGRGSSKGSAGASSSNGGGPSSSGSGSPSSSGAGSSSSNGGSSSSNGGGANGSSGNGSGGTATAILQTNSTQLTVTVQLDASKQSEAKVGEPVAVEMPNGSTVDGRISAVSPVAQSSSNSGSGNSGNGNSGSGNSGSGNSGNNGSSGSTGNSGSSGSTIPVTVTLSGHQGGAAGLDQAEVSVNFSQAQANNVLSVPVTALLATAGGGYAVQEAGAPHTLIPVTTGLFAAGYVQISGQGIHSGLQVTDSQG